MKREITYYMEEYYPVEIVEDTEKGSFTITLLIAQVALPVARTGRISRQRLQMRSGSGWRL
ncbi:hypothetical protein DW723_16955 [Blautia obeum]|uniref:Uncharacterized protein n=1 Tax=Blautia obeum TaxID=40520 RepID=A0A414K641_9FIRM|nr:hypothetical protein DW723_16955 [Blautia obeum]